MSYGNHRLTSLPLIISKKQEIKQINIVFIKYLYPKMDTAIRYNQKSQRCATTKECIITGIILTCELQAHLVLLSFALPCFTNVYF